MASLGPTLEFGQVLNQGDYLESNNKMFRAELHGDGQLVLKRFNFSTMRIEYAYDSATAWAGAGARIQMVAQQTGVGREYIWGAAIFASNRPEPTLLRKLGLRLPNGAPNRSERYAPRLVMQDDGNLVAYPVPGETSGARASDTVVALYPYVPIGLPYIVCYEGEFATGQGTHAVVNGSGTIRVVTDGSTTEVLEPGSVRSINQANPDRAPEVKGKVFTTVPETLTIAEVEDPDVIGVRQDNNIFYV